MESSQKHNEDRNKSDTEDFILYDAIYIKFKNRWQSFTEL